MGTETKIRSVLELSQAIGGIERNAEKLGELHTRTTRQDEQLDRIEAELAKLVALRAEAEQRAQRKVEARTNLIDKLLSATTKNPVVMAAVGAGTLSLGGNQLCLSARSHQEGPPAAVEPAGDESEPDDTGE